MKKIEIFFRKMLLYLLLFFSRGKKSSNTPEFGPKSNLLFIRLNRVGDALITTPLLYTIKNGLGCTIYVLADKKNSFVFNNNPSVEKTFVFEKGLIGFRNYRKLLKNFSIDTVIDLHDDVSTTVSFLLAITNTPRIFGFSKESSSLYTNTITRPDASKIHIVERVNELSKLFNMETNKNESNIKYYPLDLSYKNAEEFLTNHFSDKKFLSAVNISAGSDARFWGVERYKAVLNLLSKYDQNIVLLTHPKDLDLAIKITENKFPVHSEKFDEMAALISRLDFLFSPDTAAVHLASAFEIPVFGIYVHYKTQDVIWSPFRSDSTLL